MRWIGIGLAVATAALGHVVAQAQAAPASTPNASRNLILQPAARPAAHSQRLALVIGNAAYREAPLSNPVNDAQAMAAALRAAGFTVMLHTDVDLRGLLGAVRDFGNQLRQGGMGVFYFAGHGMQIKGRNYLIPVGADIQREDEVAYAALDAQAVLDKMESAGNGANLMLLDACRNNPFARSFRSSTQGLAQMEAPVGTLVAFATAPGTVASDGNGRNGLYTQHLLEAMRKPGAKVEDVFKQVRAGVRRDSKGRQIPWESTSLEGDLYFVEPPAVVQVAPVAPPPSPAPAPAAVVDVALLDDTLWQALKDSTDPAVVRAYLDRLPNGRHASAAKARLADLQAAAAPQPSPAAPPAAAPPRPEADAPATGGGSWWSVDAVTEARRRVQEATAAEATDDPARLNELLQAEAERIPGRQSVGLPVAAPAAPRASSYPAAARPGDAWSYQQIDRWNNSSKLWQLRVLQADDKGVLILNDDDSAITPPSRLLRQLLWPAAHGYEAFEADSAWWSGMRPGESRRLVVDGQHRRSDGSLVPSRADATLRLVGTERVRVSAGEFEALRLEASGVSHFQALGNTTTIQHWRFTAWYAPEVRGFAIIDVEIRVPGGTALLMRPRAELERFDPAPAALASR
ncbi:MAG: caspase family protein [Rubrivivax sp.]